MADGTKIEWADSTWQIVTGCSVVSPGCTNCYAMRLAGTRMKHHPSRKGLTRDTKAGPVWTGEVRFNEAWLDQPLRWRKPRRVFVCAHGDLFAEGVPDEWIYATFAAMAATYDVAGTDEHNVISAYRQRHVYQVLTKRAERQRDVLRAFHQTAKSGDLDALFNHPFARAACFISKAQGDPFWMNAPLSSWQWVADGCPGLWVGVSVEDQARADERIPHLLATPAAVRFVSAEPLLSQIDLSKWLYDGRREGLPGPGGAGLVQSRAGRGDLAPSQMDGRGPSVGARLHPQDAGGAQFGGGRQLPPGDVCGWPGAAQGERASDRLDDRESAANPAGYGDQPHRRPQAKQSSGEFGTGHASAERAALPRNAVPEKEGSAGREELVRRGDRGSSSRNTSNLAGSVAASARDRGDVQHHAVGRVGDRQPKELGTPTLSWVIVGGESGPGARPMHPEWARSLRDQCAAAGVPFFFKQWGEWVPDRLLENGRARGLIMRADGERPIDADMTALMNGTFDFAGYQHFSAVGKAAAGRLLDGRTHDEFPAERMT